MKLFSKKKKGFRWQSFFNFLLFTLKPNQAITLTYNNSYDIHFNPNQNAVFVTMILSSTSKKCVKRLWAALYSKSATLCGPHNFWMQAAVCTPLI